MTLHSKTARRRPASSATATRSARKRRHLHLIDPRDGAEILPDRRVYTYTPVTSWCVEVMMDDADQPEYDASFRLATIDEQGCAVFTLSLPGSHLYPLQIRIWQNNEIEYESHVPLVFRVQSRKKTIRVRLLASVRSVPGGVEVIYKEDDAETFGEL